MNQSFDTEFRVVYLSETLRDSFKKSRLAASQSKKDFIAASVEEHLSPLVNQLRELGFEATPTKLHPARVPFSVRLGTLQQLKEASGKTGVPMVQLLKICLSKASKSHE